MIKSVLYKIVSLVPHRGQFIRRQVILTTTPQALHIPSKKPLGSVDWDRTLVHLLWQLQLSEI